MNSSNGISEGTEHDDWHMLAQEQSNENKAGQSVKEESTPKSMDNVATPSNKNGENLEAADDSFTAEDVTSSSELLQQRKQVTKKQEIATTFPKRLYLYLRWLLLSYLAWMICSKIGMNAYLQITRQSELGHGSWRRLGPDLPLSLGRLSEPTRRPNMVQVSSYQQHLEDVGDLARTGFGLAMDMLSNEHALRDLSIRVNYSDLSCKDELRFEMDRLIWLTADISDMLSEFNTQVTKTTSEIIAFDIEIMEKLKEIADRNENPPSRYQVFISSLSPLSAFNRYRPELEAKDVFMQTHDRMSSHLNYLDSHIVLPLDFVHCTFNTLRRIRTLTLDDIEDRPDTGLLAEIWAAPGMADYFERKLHKTLLTNLMVNYAQAMELMRSAHDILDDMRLDLRRFRDTHRSPSMVWHEVSLKINIGIINQSVRRLKISEQKIEGYERDYASANEHISEYLKSNREWASCYC